MSEKSRAFGSTPGLPTTHLAPRITLLAAALRYAAAGWPVFPCRAGGKEPATPNGFKNATTDEAVIRRWWRSNPRHNVAIATGTPGPDALDVDVTAGGSGFAAFNRLKRAGLLGGACALVRTPRGGLHAYYAGTGQPCGSLTRAGHFIDFKSAGGYILAPPSTVAGKPYELLDHRPASGRLDWQAIRQLLDPPRPGRAGLPRNGDGGDITHLAAWVAAQPEGNRNAGLFWAACRAAGQDPGPLLAAAVMAGLTEREAARTLTSAARRAGQ